MNLEQFSNHLKTLLQTNTKEQIYQNLLGQRYTLKQIQEGFDFLDKPLAEEHQQVDISVEPTPETVVTAPIPNDIKAVDNSKTAHNTTTSNSSMYAIGIFGATLLGIGIFSLIAANWASISDFGKLLLLSSVTLLLHALGLLTSYRFKLNGVSNTLYLAGSLAFGGCLFLSTQIFNLPFNWSDFYLLWFIGTAILGLVLKNFLQEYLGLLILVLASTFSFDFIYFYYSNNSSSNNNFATYSTIILSLVCSLVAIYWARNLRLNNKDESLNQVF